jgi:hypothetical protein
LPGATFAAWRIPQRADRRLEQVRRPRPPPGDVTYVEDCMPVISGRSDGRKRVPSRSSAAGRAGFRRWPGKSTRRRPETERPQRRPLVVGEALRDPDADVRRLAEDLRYGHSVAVHVDVGEAAPTINAEGTSMTGRLQ